jgi:alginate O-acetyltransferase complex protein AlgF
MKKIWMTLLALMLPQLAMADDAELYDPAPPPNSAFVRVIQVGKASAPATLAGKSFTLKEKAISDYLVIPAGEQEFKAGAEKATLTIDAGKYYTLIATGSGKPQQAEDAQIKNPAKSMIYFYNVSDSAGSLYAPVHKADIVSAEPGKNVSKEINALKLAVDVKAGDKAVKSFKDVQLKRRIGTTFILMGSKGAYQAVQVGNAVVR